MSKNEELFASVSLNDLTEDGLNWIITKLEIQHDIDSGEHVKSWVVDNHLSGEYKQEYSSDWQWAGPVIHREGITIGPWTTSPFMAHYGTANDVTSNNPRMVAKTPIMAAMRCYARAKLGDTVKIPSFLLHEELLTVNAVPKRNKP